MGAGDSKISSSTDFPCPDCSPFLNWQSNRNESEPKKVVVLRSLVATVKFQSALNDSLEAKAVEFLQSVHPLIRHSADGFLSHFASSSEEYLTDFIQPMMALISSASQPITAATVEMLNFLFGNSSPKLRLAIVKADLIPQLLTSLNPQSLSFTEAVDINTCLLSIIAYSLCLSSPTDLTRLGIEDDTEQQAVHETVLQQVLAPSEKYICHLCMSRFVPIILKESIRFTGLSIKFCLFLFQEQIKVLNLHGYLLSKLRFYTSSFQALTLQPSL
ncbi:hypothetical protein BLNAU_21707 [Blattamonas nauphoetae]|uniref:Uncharacterized protein n=1 Tax=Blattamonas nauphoetae TaxID=2049346 RepID=A0ABQ9WLP8_9EUKA|nr:hypothetical protein BLNAU_24698 [Blattamonas nauphoetae]KAK2943397.1 hypothetical protein BLNAU_21707 [Blattamonas nauphoetae]